MFFTTTQRHDASRHVKGGIEATVARAILACVLALSALAVAGFIPHHQAQATTVHRAVLSLSRTGVNYYDPSDYFTHCPDFSWLTESC